MTYRWRHRVLLGVEPGLHCLGDPEHVLVFAAKYGMTEWARRHPGRWPLFSAQDTEMVSTDAAVAGSASVHTERGSGQAEKQKGRETERRGNREAEKPDKPRSRQEPHHSLTSYGYTPPTESPTYDTADKTDTNSPPATASPSAAQSGSQARPAQPAYSAPGPRPPAKKRGRLGPAGGARGVPRDSTGRRRAGRDRRSSGAACRTGR